MTRLLKRIFQSYMDLPIFQKLLFGYIFIVFIPTVLLSTTVYRLNASNLLQQSRANDNTVFETLEHSYSDQIIQIDSLMEVLVSNSTVRQYLSGFYGNVSDALYIQMTALNPLCEYIVKALPQPLDLVIYSISSENIVYSSFIQPIEKLQAGDALRQRLNKTLNSVWDVSYDNHKMRIDCYHPIYSMDYSIVLGIVQVRFNPDSLLAAFLASPDVSFWTDAGEPLIISHMELPDASFGQCIERRLEPLGILVRYRYNVPENLSTESLHLLLLLSVLCLLLMGTFYAVIRLSTRNLEKLKNHILNQDPQNLVSLDTQVYKDESGQLILAFNQLADQINGLIQDVYKSRLKQMNAEYYALQAQIQPHFLFNILENIRMEAQSGDARNAALMIQRLGDYMHYNLKRGNTMVTLFEELTHAKNYLYIHKLRKGSLLEYQIECHTEPDQVSCPYLTLQPLLENALVHGAVGCSPMHISVQIFDGKDFDRKGDVVIRIQDDGCGMNRETEKSLRQMLSQPNMEENQDRHVGLYNVSRRLETIWGEKYRLQLSSEEGMGTTIYVYLKSQEGKKV